MQALLDWVSLHSEYAFFAVFIVSTLESLALVGILLPGMLFMLGVGTLIGIGTLNFWPMFFAASLGAIAGDGLSFWLGRHFNVNLRHVWPLPRFPGLLHSGEEFFHRHGAMSVLFGRFIGPLRAIIPAVAGMMKMEPERFLLFNVISALAWAPVVLLPGAILGKSLVQVSAVAMRLGLLVFIVGLAFWCLGWLINHAMRRLVLARFPLLTHAQAWRIAAHVFVYSVVVVVALIYRLQVPLFPSQEQLLHLSRSPQLSDVTEELRTVADMGYEVLWLDDSEALERSLEQQGWHKSKRWRMNTAFAWLADDADPKQLVFSDPRLIIYKFPFKKHEWIKIHNEDQVWVFRFWTFAEKGKMQPRVTLGSIKKFTLYQGVMGFHYFVEDSLPVAQRQQFYSQQAPFPDTDLSRFQRVNIDQDGRFVLVRPRQVD